MKSIKDQVAIIGMGCTQFGELWDKGVDDLIVDACFEAFKDAGIEPGDVDGAWFGSVMSGSTGAALSSPLKLDYIPVTRVENFCATGTDGLRNACYAVAANKCNIALVCGVEKLKDYSGGFPQYTTGSLVTGKTEWDMPPVNFFALLAQRYFYNHNLSFEEGKKILAKIAVKNHDNGLLSPKGHLKRKITEEQVLNAPMVCSPLGLFDSCGMSDGAAAAIITRADKAGDFRKDYVLIKALAVANGAGQELISSDYDFSSVPETVECAKAAYEEAGIKNPREEIDMAEVHDCFTIHELMIYEDLGLSPEGRAVQDLEDGFFSLDGGLPVNTDGGLKCFGHPLSATGLRMVYEVYKQLQGKAGPRQLKKVDLGLTHNVGGMIGYFNCGIGIFGRAKS